MTEPFKPLAGRVAIVTGSGGGLGRAHALYLASQGAAVVINDIAQAAADRVAEEIEGLGGRALTVAASVTDETAVAAMIARTLAAFGRIDILVNNAGIIRRQDSIDFSEDDWDAVMNTNLKTVFFLTQAVAKQMLSQGRGGKVINIASLLSFQGGIRVPSYTSSKSGLAGLTRILANEWASKGLNVNAIAPGYFDTNNTEALRADEVRNKSILDRIPAGRWGQPSDIGGAAVFLASSASDYVQGITLPVDGGWLAR